MHFYKGDMTEELFYDSYHSINDWLAGATIMPENASVPGGCGVRHITSFVYSPAGEKL